MNIAHFVTSIIAGARIRRQRRPPVIVMLKVETPDGRDAVWIDLPNVIPFPANRSPA